MIHTPYKNLETAKRINFDRLDALVSERITALKLIVQNLDKMDADQAAQDAICRDLILPNILLLGEFVTSVKVTSE